MRIAYLLCCLPLLFLSACREQQPPAIDTALMRELLKDIHLADSWVDAQTGSAEERRALRDALYQEILAKKAVEPQTFFDSYAYYIDHPELLDSIYLYIIEDLVKQEQRLVDEDRRRRGAP
ncbi:MAG: hypothetical protein OHK0039_40850 [Bacteroidia bacterium]